MYDIYSNSRSDLWRFTLGRSGNRKLITIGLNPSTATEEKSDATVAKVEQVARRNGFEGFVMLNLYPVRSTDFRALAVRANAKAFAENLKTIESVVATESKPVIWAAWGDSILAREFFVDSAKELFERLQKYGTSWQRFGPFTASGYPRHPSRLKYAWGFSPLEAKSYVRTLGS
ncbi:MAG: DUF1643 domain-containing protein [Gemmatimonadaceae bacterium]